MVDKSEQSSTGEEPQEGNVDDRQAERGDTASAVEELAFQVQLQQAEDRALRAQAELENFRKRARRELEEERRYAHLPIVNDLLPVLDNLNRAIHAADASEGVTGLLDGVKMVGAQLAGILEKHQLQRIKDLGEPFDPNLHEAIGQEPSVEFEAGTICRVTRAGYRLHDRVVRPSQVMISTGPPLAEDTEGGS
jgi:molecular chaperone GrpE